MADDTPKGEISSAGPRTDALASVLRLSERAT